MKKLRNVSVKTKYYSFYTIIFFAFFIVVYAAFFVNGKSNVWRTDGLTQHYPALLYIRKWAKELIYNIFVLKKIEIPMWDMTLGEGGDFLNIFSFRPLVWISFLFPGNYLEIYNWFRMAVSMYLAGITFSCFCNRFKRLDFFCLIGTIAYVFSGFSICYAFRSSLFLEMIIFLPLMLLGTEKILKKESKKIFIISIVFLALSYFYTLYMLTAFSVIYAIVRYCFTVEQKSFKNFFGTISRFIFPFFLGLAISAVSLIPNLILTFSSSRTGDTAGNSIGIIYHFKYYIDLLTSFLDINAVGEYGYLCLSALALIAVFYIFIIKKREITCRQKQFIIMCIIGMILCCFPVFAAFFNGFASVTNRWFFVISLGAALLITFEVENIMKISGAKLKKIASVIIIYTIFCVLVNLFFEKHIGYFSFVFIYFIFVVLFRRNFNIRKYQILLLGLLLVEVGYKAYDFYNFTDKNTISEYLDSGTVEDEVYNTSATVIKELDDLDIYRTEAVDLQWDSPYLNRNYGARSGINGISSYYSYSSGYMADMLSDLGLSQKYQNFAISSYDQRTVLDTLSAVKYVTVPTYRQNCVPYGYTYRETIGDTLIYENNNALPLMYTYDTVISYDQYEKLSMNEKEQAMLQGAVIDSDFLPATNLSFNYVTVLDKESIMEQINSQSEESQYENDRISIDNATQFTFHLPESVTGEVYLMMEGIEYEEFSLGDYWKQYLTSDESLITKNSKLLNRISQKSTRSAVIDTNFNDSSKRGYVFAKGHQYYGGKKDILFNLGYVENFSSDITLYLRNEGIYSFDNISVVVQPMDKYGEQVENLRSETNNISVEGNHITGDVKTESEKILCVAVPYSDGWSATVNGKAAEIKLLNNRYIGIELAAGENHVELSYTTPGLFLGFKVSAVAIVIFIIYWLINNKKEKKKE